MLYTQGQTECKPSEIGYNGERLAVLNKHLQGCIDDGEIQCAAYCLSRKGKVFAHGAVGKKSFRADDNTPVQPDSVRYIASITKTFTAVAIMKLVEDGVTRLDTFVREILPQFDTPPFNGITLFQLLTHTSGLHADGGWFENKYQTSYWEMIGNAYKLHDPKNGDFDWIAASLGTIGCGLRAKPDAEWAYCSYGFMILGAVIEKLTGIHAHKYIEDNITKPLGLKDTAFDLTPEMAKRYIVTDEELEKYTNDVINNTVKEEDNPWEKFKIPSTAGGLNGTAYDLSRYGNMMLSGGTLDGVRILGRKAVEKMTTLAIVKPNYTWGVYDAERHYGVGFDMRTGHQFTYSPNSFMHEGSGFCCLYIDPKEELVAAWFVPFAKEGWFPKAVYNTHNIIWSGLI